MNLENIRLLLSEISDFDVTLFSLGDTDLTLFGLLKIVALLLLLVVFDLNFAIREKLLAHDIKLA
jgi:hypothetical protein